MAKSDLIQAILKQWNERVPFLTHKTPEGRAILNSFLQTIYSDGMSNIGQSKQELKLQKLTDAIYQKAYGVECPYRVFFTLGYTDNLFQAINLMGEFDPKSAMDLDTLCHELVHVRFPGSVHGKRFQKKVDKLIEIAGDIG